MTRQSGHTIEQITDELAENLSESGFFLSTAESCTGGLVAKTLTDRAGSSEWFERGFVTYSNQSKIDLLGVKPQTLQNHGAVSEEVAREMVLGALVRSQAQVALAITGIAGPGGGNEDKPVGTVYFGFALKQQLWVDKRQFDGDREQVRQSSLLFALRRLLELLSQ